MKKLIGRVRRGLSQFKNLSMVKKTLIITCLGTGAAFGTVYADSIDKSFLEVHHVYVDGEHVGTVKDQESVKRFIDSKVKKAEKNYDGIELMPEQKIDYVEELVFSTEDETKEVKQHLNEVLTFNASAIKLQMKDQVIGYVGNLNEANKAINNVVNKYLPKELNQDIEFLKMKEDQIVSPILEKVPSDIAKNQTKEKQKKEKDSKLVLKDGSVVLDIGLTENLKVVKEGVNPTKLLTVEQLQKMLERGTKGEAVHTIKENEVLSQVASKYDLSVNQLMDMNPEISKDSVVQVGQKIKVQADKPFINVSYTVEKSETESIDFETKTKTTDSLYKGQTKIEQKGQKGKKKITYRITTKNNEVVQKEVIKEEVVEEPTEEIVLKGTKVIPSRGTGQFTKPTVGGFITSYMGSRWGSYHKGIDISGVSNRTIKAADNGTVTFAGYDGAYGYKVVINHNNGLKTMYAHMSSLSVSSGQTVQRGQKIGIMGSTGRSTGVHLHFEVFRNGANVNPTSYVNY